MQLTMRMYQTEDDYWRIREFLRRVFLLNNQRELCWHVARFDYWRWHGIENLGHGKLEQDVFIWETADGQIAAVLNREGPGDVFLQMRPDLDTPELEEEMIVVAEKHLPLARADGKRKLRVWTDSRDAARHAILTRRGLGKAVLTEGLRRLKRMGVVVAFVGGSSLPANVLYASVMGKELDLSETWIKEW